jgi:hypothetical protein
MKNIVITMALASLCAGTARANVDPPGAPQTPGLLDQIYILYGAHQPPVGDPGTYSDNGTYSTYSLNLGSLFSGGEEVVNGDVIMLQNGASQDRGNWSDVLTFSEPDSILTLTSYEGSDAAGFWADYVPSDNAVYIEETGGPYTIYTAVNGDSGVSITYQITPQVHNVVVPEPTTALTGALLLLPFGASTLRILRKDRAG